MLEKLYTTRMSSDRKTLQNRFLRLRKKSGRLSRLAALVISVMLMTAFSLSSAVMAAVGADGLEHWEEQELYRTGGVSFDMNVSGLYVPGYVADLGGQSGMIHCDFTLYDLRFEDGMINTTGKLSLSGENGTVVLPLLDNSSPDYDGEYCIDLKETLRADQITGYIFATDSSEFSNAAWDVFDIRPADAPHIVTLYFSIKDGRIEEVIPSFDDEYIVSELAQTNVGRNMDRLKAENVVFNDALYDIAASPSRMLEGGRVFSCYERKYYRNISVDGIDVSIPLAKENVIAVDSNITRNDRSIGYLLAQVYDENDEMVFFSNITSPAVNGVTEIVVPPGAELEMGKTYRVELSYWEKPMEGFVYRWLEYVNVG